MADLVVWNGQKYLPGQIYVTVDIPLLTRDTVNPNFYIPTGLRPDPHHAGLYYPDGLVEDPAHPGLYFLGEVAEIEAP